MSHHTITITDHQGVLWARAESALAGPPALEMAMAVLEAAAVGRQAVIVLDMARVPSMDSSGVGALVRLQTALATRGKRLILANPLPAVADELRLRDLSGFFLISRDIEPDMGQEALLLASES